MKYQDYLSDIRPCCFKNLQNYISTKRKESLQKHQHSLCRFAVVLQIINTIYKTLFFLMPQGFRSVQSFVDKN